MKIMNNLLVSVMMMIFATTAYSVTYNIGVLGVNPYVATPAVGVGKFSDEFEFTITSNSLVGASLK